MRQKVSAFQTASSATEKKHGRFSIDRGASLGQTGLFYRPVCVAGVQPTGTLPSAKVNTMQSEILGFLIGKQSKLKQNSKNFSYRVTKTTTF
jgi:hypothetical protein